MTVAARAYRAVLLTLAVIALVPTLLGWTSHVVRSGSMEPSISVGDVVVAQEVTSEDRIAVGRVYLYDEPGAADRTMVHRVVERRDDGDFTTAGDANELTDHLALPREDIEARGVLLVPWVGLPVVWASEGAWWQLGAWLGMTVLAFGMAARRVGGGRRTGSRHPARGLAPAASVLIALPVLAAGHPSLADAAFTDRTSNGSNAWQAGPWTQPYIDAVLADSPSLLWLLDEEGGAWADDYSDNDNTGRYVAIADHGLPGGLPDNHGYAIRPGATGRVIDDGPAVVAPGTFTLELWFRTTSATGGRLIGFGSTRDATSRRSDRTVHMGVDGRLVYGAWGASSRRTLVSPQSYNDGRWHHLAVVATALGNSGNQDSVLYVDGLPVASGGTTQTRVYSGWWRVGYGTRPTGTTAPSSSGFDGLVDNVAVYPTALPAARVAEHYRVR